MEIVPIVDTGLGNSSYVVDLGDGGGLVVDPERDPTPYLAVAEEKGLRLRWAAETHLHADFVSGLREVAAHDARMLAPAAGHLDFEHRGVADGDELDLGGLTLEVISTPGHTPEHCAYLLRDGSVPLALFTGGTLMAGGVARTDLVSPDLTEELARAAYRSIRDRLLTLPDDLAVFPTHGAGSFCSALPTGERTTTIGRERNANPLLQATNEDDFVARLLGGYGTFPSYFMRLREVNRAGPRLYGTSMPAPPLMSPTEVALALEGGEVDVVDVRSINRFAAGHVPGSLSIQLSQSFATWLGWLVDADRDLIIVVDPGQDVSDVVRQALKVGYERIVGLLDGGIEAWTSAGRPVAQVPIVEAGEVRPDTPILDVRQRSEWDLSHVPEATHLELGSLSARIDQVAGEALVHCEVGHRAMTAASLLHRAGNTGVMVTRANQAELTRALASAQA